MTKQRLATAGWVAAAAVVLVYAPMAFEYMWRFFGGGPELWNHTFAAVTDAEHAYGPGSIHHEKAADYAAHRWVLLAHTTLGGTAIALFVLQLSDLSRRRLAVHRWTGRVAGSLAVTSMVGAIVYLLLVGPSGTYDGPAFYLQLWALALGTLLGTIAGVAAARRRQIAVHRVFMAYAFALLCTAPFLRLLYLVLGLAWPDSTQLVTNLAGGAILAVLAPLAAILASRTMPVPPRRAHLRHLPGQRLDFFVRTLALLAVVLMVLGHRATVHGLDRIAVSSAVAMGVGLLVTALNLRGATATMGPAYEEWRIHHLALQLGLPATGLLWVAYGIPFTAAEAFNGALLTGPAATLSAGLWLVAWRRRLPATASRRDAAATSEQVVGTA